MRGLILFFIMVLGSFEYGFAGSSQRIGRVVEKELSLNEAELLVETYLKKSGNPHRIMVVPGKTTAYDFGYVIECLPKKVLEGGSVEKFGVPGVGLIIVDKNTREIHEVGSVPREVAISSFRKRKEKGSHQ